MPNRDELTCRERIRRCALCLPIDRAPFTFYFGPWHETVERWEREGVPDAGSAWQDPARFGFDKPIFSVVGYVNHLYCPAYEPRVIERRGHTVVQMDNLGILTESIEGKSGIPKIIKSPVENLDDWLKIKAERLNPDDPRRFSKDWPDIARQVNADDRPVLIGCYPCGLYGTLRDLMGVEGSLLAFYDNPELVHTIMADLTDFWIALFERICRSVTVDILHIWEDMSGKQGPLISPAFVREFMIPHYKRMSAFAAEYGIACVQVDTDGDCEALIEPFHEGGVNMLLPFEVNAGSDVVSLRRRYPYMSMMGGIDKIEIAKGPAAIDRELARIEPLLRGSGYIPALDHLIPPEISFADYSYFTERLRGMIFG
ncbi:hypothetical protein AGMMS49992_03100 [Clostridia bacterium]|nr:hypothetical protein AGMMS49992_03100 [Clostridia bacterium]